MEANPFSKPGSSFRQDAERRAAAARRETSDQRQAELNKQREAEEAAAAAAAAAAEQERQRQQQEAALQQQQHAAMMGQGYAQMPPPVPGAGGGYGAPGAPLPQRPPPGVGGGYSGGQYPQPQTAAQQQGTPSWLQGQQHGAADLAGGTRKRSPSLPPGQAMAPPIPLGQVPPVWVNDSEAERCAACMLSFDWKRRRHHCRACGRIFCGECSAHKLMLPVSWNVKDPSRVCNSCAVELGSMQESLIQTNSNALRENTIREGARRYLNRPINFTLGGEIRKAAHTMYNLMSGVETVVEDHSIVEDLIRNAKGLLFITVAKISFIGGLRVGTGLLISRVNNERGWSAPCAVGSFGLSFGAEVGIETTDMIIPIYDDKSMAHFTKGTSHLMMGGEAGLALGPIGRTATAEASVSRAGTSTTRGYAHSKGIYGGIALQGAYVKVRRDVNTKFYGCDIPPANILNGQVPALPAAKPLYDALDEYRAWVTGTKVLQSATPPSPSR